MLFKRYNSRIVRLYHLKGGLLLSLPSAYRSWLHPVFGGDGGGLHQEQVS